jgi:pimeloyl-ACP methyl ester carboxylesterase
VLLPGTGLTARSWDVVAASLSATRSVLAVDLRGHGASGWPGEYSIELMAQDVAALLERRGGLVDLVGHSLGGLVGLRVAAAHPALVRRLVLEDVGMPHPRRPSPPARPEGELEFDWRVVEQVRPQVDDPDPGWPAVARSVAAPTLVVAGGPRSFVAAEHVAELVAALPDGRSVTLDTGHEVHEGDPAGFSRELLTFLG